MIEKCAISNINNNMQFIGLIILLLILCIVLLYYIKISSKTHNEIIEKYNNGNTQSSVNKSPYLNTSGRSPELQNTSDGHKDARYPTSNNAKISTATLRPCQIHFNDDGTSKYIYEDEWKEFNTLISDEDGTVYSVPYKKFSNDNNNVKDFINYGKDEREKDIKKLKEKDAAYYRDEYHISQGLLELAEERQEERDERRRQRAYAGQEGGRRIKMHSRNYYKKRTCKRCAYKKNRGNV